MVLLYKFVTESTLGSDAAVSVVKKNDKSRRMYVNIMTISYLKA
jgi:hypothetical protein